MKIIDVENHQQNPFINTRNKDLFNFREYDSYPVDHSAIKQIEFELRINTKNQREFNSFDDNFPSDLKRIIYEDSTALKNCLINYFEKNIKFFYELKNTNNKENKINHIESNAYSNINEKNIGNLTSNKDDVYIESLSHIFSKLLDDNKCETELDEVHYKNNINFNTIKKNPENENKFFYILLPLYACYFFNNMDSSLWNSKRQEITENGILISNISRNLEKKLNDTEIEFDRIELNEPSGSNSLNISSKKRNSEKGSKKNSNILTDYTHFIQGDNYDQSDSSIIFIKNYNQNLFFNDFINNYEESFFKILSPFPFSNSQCKTNRILIEDIKNGDFIIFRIKIFGCIFQNYLEKILFCLENIFDSFTFSINHFYKTPAFHLANDTLNQSNDNVKYENKKYFIKIKK